MAIKIEVEAELETHTCATCGMLFAAPEHWVQKQCRDRGATLYCPAGHNLTFGKGTVQKLKDELAAEKHKRDQAEAAKSEALAKAVAAQDALAKTKQRVGNGTCPCCKRHFKALRRHMACKHPEYKAP